ncbi:MAG: SMC-Scp complex subunit ScpB [Candidatus Doudnabacteria bacterium RIFCSPHIGHO2_02_FULL_46_11]|uniref:SMC-Scp complex subunit ScpB n=1 Tax=Candidatus Doudnabacteria bacterium RIFCSPHIGHO2_02_FULL_46_11 TaxID=1817832 RepID=A0A1F5P4B3_9BACT|nr:MAG: SMC-Scp complex subunit ScpB [Candidatus Doudnabacteria bacterium RIFCSPHIGHO2_02_FULL_46_11]
MKNDEKLKKNMEAILFMAGNPVSISEIAKSLEIEETQAHTLLDQLQAEWQERGIVISHSGNSYQMVTSSEASPAVKNFIQAQLREKLTEAAVETLSIITYKQPVSKTEIESIRGVNSQYILKLLLQRGLIEKLASAADARVQLYQTTHEFLHHLGVKSLKELPDFEEIIKNITLPETEIV